MAIVSLTYDDGLRQHADVVAPRLAELGLHATFFAPLESDVLSRPAIWTQVSENGHEIGNHTIFHPCRQKATDGNVWPRADFDMARYSLDRYERELLVADRVLRMIDGRERRAFAATCGDVAVGPAGAEETVLPILRRHCAAARTAVVESEQALNTSDRWDVRCIMCDGWTLEQLDAVVGRAVRHDGWLTLVFHGVGPEQHGLFIDTEVHWAFCEELTRRPDVRTAPFLAACDLLLP